MKRLIVVVVFLCFTSIAFGQIKASEASKHIGEKVTVSDTVKGYKVIKPGFTLLDLGARYPNQLMTVVLKGDMVKLDVSKLVGHAITVSGTIVLYREKPEIVVTEPDQIH